MGCFSSKNAKNNNELKDKPPPGENDENIQDLKNKKDERPKILIAPRS
jgi:hypothetical protein